MIIVFGASGFIGTYLVDRLVTDGFTVIASDISRTGERFCRDNGVPFIVADITRESRFHGTPHTGIDAVVNCACLQPANVSKKDYNPAKYIETNVIGTLNILEFCRRHSIPKMIGFNSHRTTAGLWGTGEPIAEKARCLKYTGEYAMFALSGGVAEDCIEHYNQEYGLQGIMFRLPPVYGYGGYTEIFKNGVPTKTGFQVFIESAIAGEPIAVWGDSRTGRDIIYVKDVASAVVAALRSDKAIGVYNIASGVSLSLEEEAETIVQVFSTAGKVSQISYQPFKPNSIESFVYDISKAKRELGWSPEYSFREMLEDYKREMESGKFEFMCNVHQKIGVDDNGR